MSASTGIRDGMNLPLGVLRLVALLLVTVAPCLGSPGEIAGVIAHQGEFEPKVRVTMRGSAIQVTKLDPNESFESVSITFIFRGADRPDAFNDLVIQWEKAAGRMGREWPLASHKGFDSLARLFRNPWQKSNSLRLIDKSGKRFVRDARWQNLIRVSLDGKALVNRPPVSAAQIVSESDPDPPVALTRPMRTQFPAQSRAEETPQLSVGDQSALKILSERYRSLEERLLRLENALAMTQNSVTATKDSFETGRRWLYWGPLLALTLAVLFTTVSLYLTFTRLSRGTASRRISLPHHGVPGFSSEKRFRRAV